MAEILLGVTGGAAAFKAVTVASLLRKSGHRVNCIVTKAATRFVTPLQLASVSGMPCFSDMFASENEVSIPHIVLTDKVDLMVIVPATAHFIARAAHGMADDLLTTSFLACSAPVLIAPAMNTRMWNNPAVQANVKILYSRGISFAGPVSGSLACGSSGEGRMVEPADIVEVCTEILNPGVST